jgi:NAD-dependent SIR2 family protein deacetylase
LSHGACPVRLTDRIRASNCKPGKSILSNCGAKGRGKTLLFALARPLHFQTQHFARFALGDDFKGPATDLAIGHKPLRRGTGVNNQIKALAAKRAANGFTDFHAVISKARFTPLEPNSRPRPGRLSFLQPEGGHPHCHDDMLLYLHNPLDMTGIDDKVRLAAQAIAAADALLVTAGAGMGVDSALPDFRGSQGFWRAYPAIAKLQLSFEEMANPAWFRENPHLAWAFYGHRLNLYRNTVPHHGFDQLLEIGSSKPYGYFVFTSNVDGQFQKAGFAQERVVECHGSIHHFQCTAGCTAEIWDADNETVSIEEKTFRALEPLPSCRNCSALARPNILMFGDWSWLGHRTDGQHRRFDAWLNEVAGCSARLAVIELGAGRAIPTVRHTSERVLQRIKGMLIRINPREDNVPAGQIGLPFGAAEGVRRICESEFDPKL